MNLQLLEIPPSNADMSVVWAGGNDFIYQAMSVDEMDIGTDKFQQLALETAQHQIENIRYILRHTAAEHTVVALNMPQIELAPMMQTAEQKVAAVQFTTTFNSVFESNIETLMRQYPNRQIVLVDVSRALGEIVAATPRLGLKPVDEPCVIEEIICDAPSKHLFYDQIHPSAWVHVYLAHLIVRTLEMNLARPPCKNTDDELMARVLNAGLIVERALYR